MVNEWRQCDSVRSTRDLIDYEKSSYRQVTLPVDRDLKYLRFSYFLLACLLTAQPAHADIIQVPRLAGGSVNIEEVLSGFELAFRIFENAAQSTEFTGELLGEPLAGGEMAADTMQGFALAIEAPTLSEHGNFLIAVLVTEAICARNALSPGKVLWSDTSGRKGTTWEVWTSCVGATD